MFGYCPCDEINDSDVVILLQRHHGLVILVDIDELRFRIIAAIAGKTSQVDIAPNPIRGFTPMMSIIAR
jgi:hypothetical protein